MASAKTKPHILILTDWYTPGFRAGGPIQSVANLVAWLKDEARFTVITSDRDQGMSQAYSGIPLNQWVPGNHGENIFYATPDWLSFANLKKLIAESEYDFILMNSMYSRPFTLWPLRMFYRKKGNTKLILAPRGMLAKGALSIKPLKKKIFLNFFRTLGVHRNLTFLATGNEEVNDIRREFPKNAVIFLAPNLPSADKGDAMPLQKECGKASFISVARMAEVKNNLFLISLFRDLNGECRLDLYGPVSEPAYFKKCIEELEKIPANIRATFHGELPQEHRNDALKRAHFFIMTSLSENFGHAIFEALSAGKPVIISDTTPWKNLASEKAGWELPLGSPEKFRQIIQQCIDMEDVEYQQWSVGAAELSRRYMAGGDILRKYRELFNIESNLPD